MAVAKLPLEEAFPVQKVQWVDIDMAEESHMWKKPQFKVSDELANIRKVLIILNAYYLLAVSDSYIAPYDDDGTSNLQHGGRRHGGGGGGGGGGIEPLPPSMFILPCKS